MSSTDKDWKPRRVLIDYDGSDGAEDAVALAKTLCGDTDARYLLVQVLLFPGPPPVAGELLGHHESAEWKVYFKEAEKALGKAKTQHQVYVAAAGVARGCRAPPRR